MAVPATQPGDQLKKIRSYIDTGLEERDIHLLIDHALKEAEENHVPIDVQHKFPDGESLAELAERKKLIKVTDLFANYTSLSASFKTLNITTGQQDAQSGPSSKKRKVSPNDGKAIDTHKNTGQSTNPPPSAANSSKQNENSGLRSFLHGIAYQLKLILIIFAHAYDLKRKDKDFCCTIATEDPDAGKFDDIVYKYDYQRVSNTVYIQAKHKKNSYKIVKNDLTTSSSDSPFAVVPYFSSFLELNQRNNAHTQEYVLTTNASIDESLLPMLERVQRVTNAEIDSLFSSINDPKSSTGNSSCYRFNWGKLHSTHEYADMIEQLRRCSHSCRLAKELAEHIHSQKAISLKTGLFKRYGAAIFTNIVGKVRNKKSNQYYVHDSFLPPNVSRLQTMFEEEYKQLKPKVTNVWQDVAIKGVKLTDGFVKHSEQLPQEPLPDDEVTDGFLEKFFKHFILVCSTVDEEALDNNVVEQWENTIAPQLCTDQLSSIATENACAAMTQYVFNWMKSRKGGFLNECQIESFYAQIIHKIQFLQLRGITDKRLAELHQSSIEIARARLEAYSFYSHLSSTDVNGPFLHRSHYDTGLVTKIVWETLETLQTAYECIFLDDASYWHLRPALEGIFQHLTKTITLVVECKSGKDSNRLVEHSREKLFNEPTCHRKKVIIIEQIGAEDMKAAGVDRFLMSDLTPASKRNMFHRHQNLRHFGVNVPLGDIVNDKDDLMYMFDLTKQQPQSRDIIEQRYSKIEPWFIDRTVKDGFRLYETKRARYRTSAQMQKFTQRDLSVSTFCSELTWKLEVANNLSAKRFDVVKIKQKMREQNITAAIQEGNKMHIIVDEPGIGKTTYLTWLAKKLQQKHPTHWIMPLISIEYATDFAQLSKARATIDRTVAVRFLFELLYLAWYVPKINRQSIEETDPVREEAKRCSILLAFNSSHKVIINDHEAVQLDSLQLAHLRIFQKKYNDSKMIILFDAFDEIAPHYKEVVLALFVQYNSMPGIAQIYLTSRPNMFESDFQGSFPPSQQNFYHLQAFSERDQIVYLDKFLRRTFKEYAALQGTPDQDQKRYELLCILHNITDELVGDRKQIPLFMSISSELLLPLVQAHVTFAPNGITVSTSLIEEAKTLYEPQNMMKKFIDRKLYILNVEKTDSTDSAYNIPAMQSNAEELNMIKRRKHTLLALYAMCDESEIEVLLDPAERTEALEYMNQVQRAQEKSGIVEAFNGNIPQFLHRNIAEFLVAEWIFNNIFKENVRSYLLSDQYWLYSKRVIRDYLNRMLASGSLIHQAVINQHSLEVGKILKTNPGDANTLDVGGRTPLHLASELGNLLQHQHSAFRDMFSELLEAYAASTINQRDNIFHWTALEYALRTDSLQAIPMLIQHGAQVDAKVLAEQILHGSKDPYKKLERAVLYETHLWTNDGQYQDCVILTNRMVAQTLLLSENLNIESTIQICTQHDTVELLKSLLLPNNVIDLAFYHNAVDVMQMFVTSKHDIPTNIQVDKAILEACAQRGNTKLFEILFQKYCQQNSNRYNRDKNMELEQSDGLGALQHLSWYFPDFYNIGSGEEMLDPLEKAVSNGNLAIVMIIIKKSTLVIDNETIKYLILNAAHEKLADHEQLACIFKCLLEASSDIRATDSMGRTLLHCVVNMGYVYMVKFLIEKKGFSALTVNENNGWNAFHYCIPQDIVSREKTEQYYCQIFNFMMEKEGVDGIHAVGLEGENVLHLAVTKRYFKVGKLIITSMLKNVPTKDAQRKLEEYLKESNLSNKHICRLFFDCLLEETDVQDELKVVFSNVREFLKKNDSNFLIEKIDQGTAN